MQNTSQKLQPKTYKNLPYNSKIDDSDSYKIGVFIDHGEEGEGYLSINETYTSADIISGGILQGLNPFEDSSIVELISPNGVRPPRKGREEEFLERLPVSTCFTCN